MFDEFIIINDVKQTDAVRVVYFIDGVKQEIKVTPKELKDNYG